MARLRKNHFGHISGKLNNSIFKQRKKKQYIASMPGPRTTKYSPAEIERHQKFKFFAQLTTVLHSDNRIKTAWERSSIEGECARNKIMKINFRRVDTSRDLSQIKLMPFDDFFPVQIKEISYNKIYVKITFMPIDAGKLAGSIISAHGVVVYKFPPIGMNDPTEYLIMQVISQPVPYRKGEEHTFEMEWDPTIMNECVSKQFCLTLIIETKEGVPAASSENVVVV